jgi:hypothetical protein
VQSFRLIGCRRRLLGERRAAQADGQNGGGDEFFDAQALNAQRLEITPSSIVREHESRLARTWHQVMRRRGCDGHAAI